MLLGLTPKGSWRHLILGGGWPVRQIHKYLLNSFMLLLLTPSSAFSLWTPSCTCVCWPRTTHPAPKQLPCLHAHCCGLGSSHAFSYPCPFLQAPPTTPPLPFHAHLGSASSGCCRPLSSHHFWKPAGPHRPLPHTWTLQTSLRSLKCLFPLSGWIAEHFQGREHISEP